MIKICNLYKSFGSNRILDNVSLSVEEGDVFGIIGHSGAGKSTLIRCLNALEKFESGSINVMGKELSALSSKEIRFLRKNIGMIFQNFNLMNSKNVFDNVALPLQVWGKDKKQIEHKVRELVSLVGLEDKLFSMPKELSGGQKQRVAIARALALEPKLIFCDEATSALDPSTTRSILKLLREINEKFNITIIIVTHQMEVVKEICNKVAVMEKGEIKALGKVEEVFVRPQDNLKNLINEKEILPEKGVNIKIFFDREQSQKSIITAMARELDIDFSIAWGRLEKYREEVLGSLVINVEEKHKDAVIRYLKNKSMCLEVFDYAS